MMSGSVKRGPGDEASPRKPADSFQPLFIFIRLRARQGLKTRDKVLVEWLA